MKEKRQYTLGNDVDADADDDEKIEGGGSDDGAGTQLAGLELVAEDFDDGEKNFRR